MKKLLFFVVMLLLVLPGYSQANKAILSGTLKELSNASKQIEKARKKSSTSGAPITSRKSAQIVNSKKEINQTLQKIKEQNERLEKDIKELQESTKKSAEILKRAKEKSKNILPELPNPSINMLKQYKAGKYESNAEMLLKFACISEKVKDMPIALEAMHKAEQIFVHPTYIISYIPNDKRLKEGWRKMTINSISTTYVENIRVGTDSISNAEIQRRDSIRNYAEPLYLKAAALYAPEYKPIVKLAFLSNELDKDSIYFAALDSIAQHPDSFSKDLQIIVMNMALRNIDEANINDKSDISDKWFEHAGNQPLKAYIDSVPEQKLIVCDYARRTNNIDLFNRYFNEIMEADSNLADTYFEELYKLIYDDFVQNPIDKPTADWLLEYAQDPIALTILLIQDIEEKHLAAEETAWEWVDSSNLTPEIRNIYEMEQYLTANAMEKKNLTYYPELIYFLMYDQTNASLMFAEKEKEVKENIQKLADLLEADKSSGLNDLRAQTILLQAFITAHGLDNPKAGIKLLEKKSSKFDAPDVDKTNRFLLYDYLTELFTATKNNKKAAKAKEKRDNILVEFPL